jgi:hypothetical protein
MPNERRTEIHDDPLPRQAPLRGGPRDVPSDAVIPGEGYGMLGTQSRGARNARLLIGVALIVLILVVAVLLLT